MRRFGEALGEWQAPEFPRIERLEGETVRLERLRPDHAHSLFRAYQGADANWDYLPYGPFPSEPAFIRFVAEMAGRDDPWMFALVDPATGQAAGMMAFLRIDPAQGTIELGHINLAPALQGTRAASEAMILAIGWAFEAGYRRFEWKCDALNLPSRRAAQRLGLSYEGTFRQAAHYKGRNRDTAWFAAIDRDWPGLASAYAAWLAPTNFGPDGAQVERLSDLTRLVRAHSDPLLDQNAAPAASRS